MHLALLSTLFLLREVESGTANISAWSFDHADKKGYVESTQLEDGPHGSWNHTHLGVLV